MRRSMALAWKPVRRDPKPNIVLVLMDNLGWGELGVYGGGIIRGAPTPRLDAAGQRRIPRLSISTSRRSAHQAVRL